MTDNQNRYHMIHTILTILIIDKSQRNRRLRLDFDCITFDILIRFFVWIFLIKRYLYAFEFWIDRKVGIDSIDLCLISQINFRLILFIDCNGVAIRYNPNVWPQRRD